MATPESITELWTNFKSLVKKVTYDKTEVDNKLSQKANNTLSTVSANGLMSSDDKTKLNGIESGANKTVVDTSISPTSTNPVQNRVINTELASKASTAIATTSKNGLMSAADKTKLNGISTEANKTIVDSALSTTSTNPVQNKVINSEITSLNNSLANKANANHIHSRLNPTSIPENADLNDYTTQGSFYCPMNVTATSLANCPTNKAFHLEVYRHVGVRQILYCYYDTEVWTYERNFTGTGSNGNKWSEWHKVPTDDDITSLNSTITNKADKNHTHSLLSGGVSYRQVDNDYDGLPVYCSIKNGFAFLTWNNPFQYLNSNGSIKQTGVYFQIGYVAAPDIDEGSIYRLGSNWRLKINKEGKLEGFVDVKDAWTYGTWVYPTSSTSLPYPDD